MVTVWCLQYHLLLFNFQFLLLQIVLGLVPAIFSVVCLVPLSFSIPEREWNLRSPSPFRCSLALTFFPSLAAFRNLNSLSIPSFGHITLPRSLSNGINYFFERRKLFGYLGRMRLRSCALMMESPLPLRRWAGFSSWERDIYGSRTEQSKHRKCFNPTVCLASSIEAFPLNSEGRTTSWGPGVVLKFNYMSKVFKTFDKTW